MAFEWLVLHVNLRMASQVSFADESFFAVRTLERFVIGLYQQLNKIRKNDFH